MLDYKTGVVGAGRVGAGMATLMAGHGCWVTIVGLDEEDLSGAAQFWRGIWRSWCSRGLATEQNRAAIRKRFILTTDPADLRDCVFVLEAAFENLEVKRGIYREVEEIVSPETLMASTTSAISAELLTAENEASGALRGYPSVPAGAYAAVGGAGRRPKTTPETIGRARRLLEELDREVVTLHKSVPGFIINRFAQALFRESLYLVEQGVVSVEDGIRQSNMQLVCGTHRSACWNTLMM